MAFKPFPKKTDKKVVAPVKGKAVAPAKKVVAKKKKK